MIQAALRAYAGREARIVAPLLGAGRVLDLGAGEGYVTERLRRDAGRRVCAADVGPYRRAPVPYVVYDGERLPFRDGAFETTLLLFTLHHCGDPDRVLAEAIRVTRARVVILESVFASRRERRLLEWLDPWFNGRRHGGAMRPALHVASADRWRRRLAAYPVRVAISVDRGAWWERPVHRPHLLVADV